MEEILILHGVRDIINVVLDLQKMARTFLLTTVRKDFANIIRGYIHTTLLNSMEKASSRFQCSIRASLTPELLWDIWRDKDHSHSLVIHRRRKDKAWFVSYFSRSARSKTNLVKVAKYKSIGRILPNVYSRLSPRSKSFHYEQRASRALDRPVFPMI